jgi:Amidohydrolase family
MSRRVTPTAPALIDSTAPGTSFHLRAIRLPDGNREKDWWIANGRLQQQPVAGATELDGCYVMSGMVDAHTHLSMGFGRFDAAEGSAAVIRANLDDKVRQGVLAVRDVGVLPGAPVRGAIHPQVRVIACGNLNAPAGRFHDGIYRPVEPRELRAALLAEVAAGQRWVKIVADFPGPDFNFFDPIVNYPLEVVQDAVNAVHAAGGRVAAHVSGPIADDLVRAGVDSIEHGTMLTHGGIEEMARRGTAWVPTLSTVVGATDMMTAHGAPFIPVWRVGLAKLKAPLPLAENLS